MRQVAAVRQVKTEDAVMGVEDGGVGVEVCRRAGESWN
jgi:hypothetical protein